MPTVTLTLTRKQADTLCILLYDAILQTNDIDQIDMMHYLAEYIEREIAKT